MALNKQFLVQNKSDDSNNNNNNNNNNDNDNSNNNNNNKDMHGTFATQFPRFFAAFVPFVTFATM